MSKSNRIVLIREEKTPSDSRVVLTPLQCRRLKDEGYDISIQQSNVRAYTDDEYQEAGIEVVEEIHDFDILIGVKEVPISNLVPQKTYFFFSHTIKEQPYNKRLLQTAVERQIRLIDYEVITNDNGQRLIAFGKFAGMVGAHNGLWTYAQKTGLFDLPRMHQSRDYEAVKQAYSRLILPPVRIVLTGTGRVAQGAAMVLEDMGIKKISAQEFLRNKSQEAVFTQLHPFHYASRKDGRIIDSITDFFNNPSDYQSEFRHYYPISDIFINGIYWDNDAPAFFTLDEMKENSFRLKVIADVTCDIAPVTSVPSTIKASTIADPVFGFDVNNLKETDPFEQGTVDMMTIDNLPNELPRDASKAFGEMFIEHVLPELYKEESDILDRATICQGGKLNTRFEYLTDYIS